MEPSEDNLKDVIRFAGAVSLIKEADQKNSSVVLTVEHVKGLIYGLRLLAVKPKD